VAIPSERGREEGRGSGDPLGAVGEEGDAAAFLALSSRLDEETAFRLLAPGERLTTVDEQREIIGRCRSVENDTILATEAAMICDEG
jgi:hypothetical protein